MWNNSHAITSLKFLHRQSRHRVMVQTPFASAPFPRALALYTFLQKSRGVEILVHSLPNGINLWHTILCMSNKTTNMHFMLEQNGLAFVWHGDGGLFHWKDRCFVSVTSQRFMQQFCPIWSKICCTYTVIWSLPLSEGMEISEGIIHSNPSQGTALQWCSWSFEINSKWLCGFY